MPALAAIVALAWCSHGPDGVVEPELPLRTVQLGMAMDLKYGVHADDMNSVCENDHGHAFVLDTLRFLASRAQEMAEDDVLLADHSTVHMIMNGGEGYREHLLCELTAPSLHEILFTEGVATRCKPRRSNNSHRHH